VTINCGAIPKHLLESELFGHREGSFTGAVAHKIGKVETAEGGTLFLDEVGELPPEWQVKLLRLIPQGEIETVGPPAATTVDIRIVAATNRDLRAMVEDGAFRDDLFYRLAIWFCRRHSCPASATTAGRATSASWRTSSSPRGAVPGRPNHARRPA
jgi:two-component system NtrC family response regulator